MGRQINFFMAPEDLKEFDSFVFRDKSVSAIPNTLVSTVVSPLELARTIEGDFGSLRVYIFREQDLERVRIRRGGAEGSWVVDGLRSPTVEIFRSYFDGQILRRGRLFFDLGYCDDNSEWVDKPSDFLSWAQGLVHWIRGQYVKDEKTGCYVGTHAWDWHVKEGGNLVTM